ncbi:MAG: hypothetical protein J0I06_07830 [Planctomycetes bacterium]|nr:hypothetical protein [Planctomycetota bacterium]
MARTTNKARSSAAEEARYRSRLIRWAELMDRVQDFDAAIEHAKNDGVIESDSGIEAQELLTEVHRVLASAVPLRRASA